MKRQPEHKPNHGYKIILKISIDEAVQKIRLKQITSKRFKYVMRIGECCVECGLKRDHVALGIDNGGNKHWDLYAADGTLLTIDHIVPKAKGGSDKKENYQLMCSPCNHKKSDKLL